MKDIQVGDLVKRTVNGYLYLVTNVFDNRITVIIKDNQYHHLPLIDVTKDYLIPVSTLFRGETCNYTND